MILIGHPEETFKNSGQRKESYETHKHAYNPWKGTQCSILIIATAVIAMLVAYSYHITYQQEPFSKLGYSDLQSPSYSSPTINNAPHDDEILPAEADIFTPHKLGPKIVELCIQKLKSPVFNMPDDNEFMKRVAYVMSEFGRNMKDYGGIWQVTPAAFEDTMDTRAHKRLPRKYEQIFKAFNIDWKSVRYKDLDKPFYSALAARLYLSNYPEYIPPAHQLYDQASYWKFKYMAGSGDIQSFMEKVNELKQLEQST